MAVAAREPHAPAELPVEPSLDEVRALAREHNLVALRHSFIDDLETPVSAFLKLRGRDPQFPAFLLESAEQGQRVGRFSFIGVRPRKVVRWSLGDGGDPYALAAAEVGAFSQAPFPDAPPFAGGAVGFFGYDLVRTVEPLGDPNPDAVGLPDMALMLSDVLVVFDHLKHTITILVNVYADDGDIDAAYADALATIEKARRLLAGPVPAVEPTPARARPDLRVQHAARAVRGDGRADRRVRARRRRLPGRPLPALERRARRRPVLDLPRPAGGQPEPVHVLPGLPGLPDRRRLARAAADGHRAPRLDAARSPARARAAPTPPRTRRSPTACWPTRRSAPST